VAEHRFEVVVVTDDHHGENGDDRSLVDYAKAALTATGLRDAEHLDGFADLHWTAYIDDVQEI
jgi:hypothetical protein